MKKRQPNILVFMTDQQRGDSIAPYGRAHTPHLDRFCAEGLTFSQAYCPSPHCCPSRASFFSGLYPSQHGVWNNINVGNTLSRGLYPDVRLWSQDLQEAGYQLFFTGKWHVDADRPPTHFGFRTLSSPEQPPEAIMGQIRPDFREWQQYLDMPPDPQDRQPGQILRPGYGLFTLYGETELPFKDHLVVNDAIALLQTKTSTEAPWCLYAGTLGPHDPYFVPDRFLDLYPLETIRLPENFTDTLQDKPNLYRRTRDRFSQLSEDEHREAIRHYLAFCSYEDELFGQLLQTLADTGQASDTLVVYLSDHGDYMADHGLWCKGLPCFRGAYHVPCAMRWPQGIKEPGRVVDAFISLTDFAPTFLELAGIKADRSFAGASMVPFMLNKQPQNWRDALFTQTNGNELYGIQRSIMTRDWKYVYNGFDYDELYDLELDPGETVNRAEDPACREIVRQLSRRVWQFAHATGDVCINSYIMVSLAPYGPGEAFRTEMHGDSEVQHIRQT